ncbi:MAG: hypothetical protein ACRDH9_04400 [Actinomycetota bacterium]
MSKKGSTPIRGLVVLALVAITAIASSVMPTSAASKSLNKFLKKSAYNNGEGIYATFKDAEQQLPGVGGMPGAPIDFAQLATMATLNVPAGRYAIFAKGWVDSHGAVQHVHCGLLAGGDFDHTRTQTGEFDASLALEVVHNFGSAGTITMECADDGAAGNNDTQIQWVKIIAIRAPALTNGASA